MGKLLQFPKPPEEDNLSPKERLVITGVHTVEALGGAALLAAAFKTETPQSDFAGIMALSGSFLGAHGLTAGTVAAFRAIRESRSEAQVIPITRRS